MLLRRITKHVKEQNWFAVGLDFVIVVVGILIAFQITNWSDAHQERQDEQRYLAEIAQDLEADIAEAQTIQDRALALLGLNELILASVAPDYERPEFWIQIDEDVAPGERFAAYPYADLSGRAYLTTSNNTFVELTQSGNISVISNRELIRELTRFYEELNENTTDETNLAYHAEALQSFYRRNGIGIGDRATRDEVIQLAKTDREFLGLIKAGAFFANWQYGMMNRIEEDAVALLATVNAARKNPS